MKCLIVLVAWLHIHSLTVAYYQHRTVLVEWQQERFGIACFSVIRQEQSYPLGCTQKQAPGMYAELMPLDQTDALWWYKDGDQIEINAAGTIQQVPIGYQSRIPLILR